uniref:Uncharacterized protein n=1 Tax=Arundo donax TaxID=35708 RepID=A0A0A9BXN8_ARUDO
MNLVMKRYSVFFSSRMFHPSKGVHKPTGLTSKLQSKHFLETGIIIK